MRIPHYPLYRALTNGASRFRIESSDHFTEVQRIGSRYLLIEVRAYTYPEKVRIAELISGRDGGVVEIQAAEFEDWLARAGPAPDAAASPG